MTPHQRQHSNGSRARRYATWLPSNAQQLDPITTRFDVIPNQVQTSRKRQDKRQSRNDRGQTTEFRATERHKRHAGSRRQPSRHEDHSGQYDTPQTNQGDDCGNDDRRDEHAQKTLFDLTIEIICQIGIPTDRDHLAAERLHLINDYPQGLHECSAICRPFGIKFNHKACFFRRLKAKKYSAQGIAHRSRVFP